MIYLIFLAIFQFISYKTYTYIAFSLDSSFSALIISLLKSSLTLIGTLKIRPKIVEMKICINKGHKDFEISLSNTNAKFIFSINPSINSFLICSLVLFNFFYLLIFYSCYYL